MVARPTVTRFTTTPAVPASALVTCPTQWPQLIPLIFSSNVSMVSSSRMVFVRLLPSLLQTDGGGDDYSGRDRNFSRQADGRSFLARLVSSPRAMDDIVGERLIGTEGRPKERGGLV